MSTTEEHSNIPSTAVEAAPVIHAVRNVGTGTGTALATAVVEKGKPLLTVAQ